MNELLFSVWDDWCKVVPKDLVRCLICNKSWFTPWTGGPFSLNCDMRGCNTEAAIALHFHSDSAHFSTLHNILLNIIFHRYILHLALCGRICTGGLTYQNLWCSAARSTCTFLTLHFLSIEYQDIYLVFHPLLCIRCWLKTASRYRWMLWSTIAFQMPPFP